MNEPPLVSVVTVNWNGRPYLEGLLRSLEAQTYPRFEILLVDNGSTDGSVEWVRRRFPEVRALEAGANLGFTGGNNLGLRQARGSYVALINNDTVVHPDWLRRLVESAEADPTVGGVGSKILFAHPYIAVTLRTVRFPSGSTGGTEERNHGLCLAESSGFVGCSYRKPIFKDGFEGPETLGAEVGRRVGGAATVYLPVESLREPGRLNLRLRSGPYRGGRSVRVVVEAEELASLEVGEVWGNYEVELPAELIRRSSFDVLNNACSFVDADGGVGDRGIYEPDRGQYDTPEDVTALCGCSMLLAKKVLDQVGFFDPDFFMYFEDTELSWRIRKAGYRLRYQPASRVRHFHAATSGERSPFFQFLVARNRILMLIRHASWRSALRAYLEEGARCLRLLWRTGVPWKEPLRTRLRIQASLLKLAPRAWSKRIGLLRG